MAGPVLAIALDSADARLCQEWMDSGVMPTLRRLRDSGCLVPMDNGSNRMVAETPWTMLWSGVRPERTGFWSQLRLQSDYTVREVAYDYKEFPPFYAVGQKFRVAAIDIPQCTLSEDVNGVQVQGYGAHSHGVPKGSRPSGFLEEINEKYGKHPAFKRDHARLWMPWQMRQLKRRLIEGAKRRAEICCDLLRQERWDLLLTVFGELHSGGHYMWHVSQPDHPLHETYKDSCGGDPLVEIAETLDQAIADMVAAAPDDTTVVVFSQEGMDANNLDLPSMVFLPELLYRHSFPGQFGITSGRPGDNRPPPPMNTRPLSLGWVRATWRLKHDENAIRRTLRKTLMMELAHEVEKALGGVGPGYPYDFGSFYWQSALWYSRSWPEMRAFALPSFSNGYVRINLKGRDACGVVEPAEYDSLCDEIINHLDALRDARTGERIVADVACPNPGGQSRDQRLSDADIVVNWTSKPADVVDSPAFGRIGPIPHRRSGGHNTSCFAVVAGSAVQEGGRLERASLLDIPPTILDLMGAPLPEYLGGVSLRSKLVGSHTSKVVA